MHILLLNPPRFHEVEGNNPSIVDEERGCNPPLGLLYLAGTLRERTRHAVTVLDAQAEKLSYQELRKRLEPMDVDVVGMTAMTLTLLDVMKSVAMVKDLHPGCRVVLGGPHVHLYPEETIGLEGVDALVLGEGENTFRELLAAWENNQEPCDVPGLVYPGPDGDIIRTAAPQAIDSLDSLALPARDLTDVSLYNSLLANGKTVTTMFTSRGCPFQCRFCDRPHLGKKFRAHSPEYVLKEIEHCCSLGIREFLIYDDTFTVNRDRAEAICDLLLERKLDISFDIRARVDTVDEALLRKLKAAGCQGVHYGVEAGTERMLKVLNKGITLEQVSRVFQMTRRIGLPVLAYFMIGNPGETREEILETFRVMKRLKPDYVHMTILTPFPGTEVYRDALERGVISHDVWREFAAHPRDDFVPPVWEEHFSRKELQDLLIQGYQSFYLRPGYILKRLLRLRSWTELKRKARAGLGVFSMKRKSTELECEV